MTGRSSQPEPIKAAAVDSFAAYQRRLEDEQKEFARRRRYERSLLDRGKTFVVEGFCWHCQKLVDFEVDDQYSYEVEGVLTLNWRERLVCPFCSLNNRRRASLHLFEELFDPPPSAAIFSTVQASPVFDWLEKKYGHVVGSEFVGDEVRLGECDARGLRNEDLTALTFHSETFDYVVSFDVFEHVPKVKQAFAECLRVLKPGGHLYFTVPFLFAERRNTVRAVVTESGAVEHLLPPEYHYDPVSEEGCLAFYHFGWELLDDLREVGYTQVQAHLVWSERFSYLGSEQVIFSAKRSDSPSGVG